MDSLAQTLSSALALTLCVALSAGCSSTECQVDGDCPSGQSCNNGTCEATEIIDPGRDADDGGQPDVESDTQPQPDMVTGDASGACPSPDNRPTDGEFCTEEVDCLYRGKCCKDGCYPNYKCECVNGSWNCDPKQTCPRFRDAGTGDAGGDALSGDASTNDTAGGDTAIGDGGTTDTSQLDGGSTDTTSADTTTPGDTSTSDGATSNDTTGSDTGSSDTGTGDI